jgi:hypothetical protein
VPGPERVLPELLQEQVPVQVQEPEQLTGAYGNQIRISCRNLRRLLPELRIEDKTYSLSFPPLIPYPVPYLWNK